MIRLRLGLAVLGTVYFIAILGAGCATRPKDGDDIGDHDDSLDFTGYVYGSQSLACIYASSSSNGTYGYVGYITASTSPSSHDGFTAYKFDGDDTIPASYWTCGLPLDGTASTYVKLQESRVGACLTGGPSETEQYTLEYTYVTGTDLVDCYGDAGHIGLMPGECGSANAPVIKLNADYTGNYQQGAGCTPVCNTNGDCNDSNDCTTDTCNANKTACSHTSASAGLSCNGGDGVCGSGAQGGVCVCEDSGAGTSGCTGGQVKYQTRPDGSLSICVAPAAVPTSYCFVGCGSSFQNLAPDGMGNNCGQYADPWPGQEAFEVDVNPGVMCAGGFLDCAPR